LKQFKSKGCSGNNLGDGPGSESDDNSDLNSEENSVIIVEDDSASDANSDSEAVYIEDDHEYFAIEILERYDAESYYCNQFVNDSNECPIDIKSTILCNNIEMPSRNTPWAIAGHLVNRGLPSDTFQSYDGDTARMDMAIIMVSRARPWWGINRYHQYVSKGRNEFASVNLYASIALCRPFALFPRRQVAMRYACHLTHSEVDSRYTFNQLDSMTDAELDEFGFVNIPRDVIVSLSLCPRIGSYLTAISVLHHAVSNLRLHLRPSVSTTMPRYPHIGHLRWTYLHGPLGRDLEFYTRFKVNLDHWFIQDIPLDPPIRSTSSSICHVTSNGSSGGCSGDRPISGTTKRSRSGSSGGDICDDSEPDTPRTRQHAPSPREAQPAIGESFELDVSSHRGLRYSYVLNDHVNNYYLSSGDEDRSDISEDLEQEDDT
jgi:hypothetical protein